VNFIGEEGRDFAGPHSYIVVYDKNILKKEVPEESKSYCCLPKFGRKIMAKVFYPLLFA